MEAVTGGIQQRWADTSGTAQEAGCDGERQTHKDSRGCLQFYDPGDFTSNHRNVLNISAPIILALMRLLNDHIMMY